ncbi:MAG TPA: UDP-2,3-diacylglucosamine diphosphatase LpxI [Pirellulales bacterium]|nr:UDP-2,3-diacylglucosamine diphosphatase LpxI [Pirellulales bacterium]
MDALGTKVGLVAGWGRYPIVIAEELRRQGRETFCLGLKGHADPRLADICTDFTWTGFGKLGWAVRYFRRHGVHHATMAGKVHKFQFFKPWVWLRHMPDFRTTRCFARHFLFANKDRKDDTLLAAAVDEFASGGIVFGPATDYIPELLVRFGQLTRRGPTSSQRKDIEFGWNVAKEMGRLDIGQSVAVKRQATIAVEAIEGTDLCIERAGQLCSAGSFTVVKVAKPRQDMRFDVPTIGLGTLETMTRAGASCLAIEAGRTIILDEPEVVDYANRHGLVIVSLEADGRLSSEPACENESSRG